MNETREETGLIPLREEKWKRWISNRMMFQGEKNGKEELTRECKRESANCGVMRLRFGSGPWMTSFQTWGHEWLGTGLPYSRLIFRLVQLERLFYVCLNSWLNVDWWNTVKNWMDWNGLKIYLSILNWLYMCRYFQCGKVKLTVIKKKQNI